MEKELIATNVIAQGSQQRLNDVISEFCNIYDVSTIVDTLTNLQHSHIVGAVVFTDKEVLNDVLTSGQVIKFMVNLFESYYLFESACIDANTKGGSNE